MTNSLFFGDSITYGEYDGILGGYVDILKRYCHTKFSNDNAKEVNVYNLGIGGETTDGLLKRFEIEVQARKSPEENLIFFLFGVNDLALEGNNQLVTIDDFEKNLQNVVDLAKKNTEHVFLISILPMSVTFDGILSSSGRIRTNENVALYNQRTERVAQKNNIPYIDMYSEFMKNVEYYISKDGIHPNEKGYELISEHIKPIIEKYL